MEFMETYDYEEEDLIKAVNGYYDRATGDAASCIAFSSLATALTCLDIDFAYRIFNRNQELLSSTELTQLKTMLLSCEPYVVGGIGLTLLLSLYIPAILRARNSIENTCEYHKAKKKYNEYILSKKRR